MPNHPLPRLPRRAALLCGMAAVLAAPVTAWAQEAYPSKPITIVVGYPPGGSTDLTGRTVAAELSHKLGVPVVIENIGGAGGAGGAIGAQKVASAAPDGYTLLVGASQRTRQFRHHAANPLDVDVLIVDETSMIHLEMMAALLQALPATARPAPQLDVSLRASALAGDWAAWAQAHQY